MKKIGRYEVIEELGRGAMGVVYKASDPTIGRLVAIKLLVLSRPAQAGLPGAKDIFLREARAAGRLSHPGIVTIHDALEDSTSQSCYIVMEFVEGYTLEKALLSGSGFSVAKALNVARQIAEALDYAHRQKIIHRDLKPANILLTADGRAKITDFGIAKVIATEDAQRTLAIMGTPAYMSPEQVTGGELDASSDIFSLGILLYLMLTGEKPFSGDTAAVMFKIAYQDPAPPSQIRAELGKGHDFILLRSLAKDKKKRYASAREFLDDLDDVEQGRPPRSEAKVPMSELHAGDLTVRASKPLVPMQITPAAAPKHSITIRPAIYIPALLILLAAGAWTLTRRNATPPAVSAGNQAAAPIAPPPVASTAKTTAPPAQPSAKAAPPATPKEKPAKPVQQAKKSATSQPGQSVAMQPAPPTAAAPPVVTPTPVASSDASKPPAPKAPEPAAATAPMTIQFSCNYEIEEATLTVTGNNQNLLSVDLKGKKTGKFLGLKHRFAGTFSRPLDVPASVHNLVVHVKSANGDVNLTRAIFMPGPNGKDHTLHVYATSDKLQLSW